MHRWNRRGSRLAAVFVLSVVGCVGITAPQALADDGATETGILDPTLDGGLGGLADETLDATPDIGVDVASDPAESTTDVTETVEGAAVTDIVDDVPDTTGALTDPVDETVGAVADSTSDATDVVPETTDEVMDGAVGAITSDTAESVDALVGTVDTLGRNAGTVDASTDGSRARSLRQNHSTLVEAARGGPGTLPSQVEDARTCPDADSVCTLVDETNEESSLVESIARILRDLAFTGFALLPWLAAGVMLTITGALALRAARRRSGAQNLG